jgi:uncharacterized protein (TIGR02246 family)
MILAFVLSIGVLGVAQETSTDEQAILANVDKWVEAWNQGDAKAIVSLYTADADYVRPTGDTFKGQQEIEDCITELMTNPYKGSKLAVETTSVRFIKPDLAVGDSTYEFTDVPEVEGQKPPTSGMATSVMVKQGDQWLIVAHRVRVPTLPPGSAPE